MRRMISIMLAVVAFGTTVAFTGSASAVPAAEQGVQTRSAEPLARPCGYSEDYPFTFWNNCRSTNAKIRVDVILYTDYDKCTFPGENLLDSGSERTRGAREIGAC